MGKADTTEGTLITSTPLADTLGANVLVGMRRTELRVILRALNVSSEPLAALLSESLQAALDERNNLRAV